VVATVASLSDVQVTNFGQPWVWGQTTNTIFLDEDVTVLVKPKQAFRST